MRAMRAPICAVALAAATLVGTASSATAAPPANTLSGAAARAADTDVPVAVDGTWVPFQVLEAGTRSVVHTFRSRGPVLVTVVDYLCRGDRYQVFDGARSLGRTSRPSPADDCADFTDSPDAALGDPDFSRGTFAVGKGRHALQLLALASPYGAATSAFRLEPAPTPESKADCKRGGWRTLYSDTGELFRNQGECVCSVAHR